MERRLRHPEPFERARRSAHLDGFSLHAGVRIQENVLECPSCAGRLEVIALIAEAGVAKRILDHLGMQSQAPPPARARGLAEATTGEDPGPDYSRCDPVYECRHGAKGNVDAPVAVVLRLRATVRRDALRGPVLRALAG